jgi:hypothetical protein
MVARLEQELSENKSPTAEVELAIKVFGTTMGAYLSHIWADPIHPTFLPSVGFYQMYGSPNPDTVYRTAVVDGFGEYLISGYRGSVPDVSIMPFGRPTPTGMQTFPPFEFGELEINDDGTFEVALSGVRPPEGNWWHLEPAMSSLMLRSVSEDWGAYVEPRLAIVRLDADPRRERYAPEAFWRRLQSFGAVVEGMIMSGVNRVAELRSNDVVNRLVAVDYSGNGGRLDQWYEEGCFSLGPDEVLLVETRLPPGCKGFSLSLTDSLFSTIDWANAQSSLNSHQAEVDTDGVLRVVVAHVDPAVHNWLDTTGQELGVLQCRWMGGGSPETSVRVISTEGLNSALPVTEPRVTAAERARIVRKRQIGVQLRSQW